eukprot:gene2121-biopygen1899
MKPRVVVPNNEFPHLPGIQNLTAYSGIQDKLQEASIKTFDKISKDSRRTMSAVYEATGTTADNEGVLDTAVSYDGKSTTDEWRATHAEKCTKNFNGTVNAMEVEAAKRFWQRSIEEHKLHYTTVLSACDSKAYDTFVFRQSAKKCNLESMPLEIIISETSKLPNLLLFCVVSKQQADVLLRFFIACRVFGAPFKRQPTEVNEDNQEVIALSKNPKYHSRTKHIDIKYHFIREKIKSSEIMLKYCSTEERIADTLTKLLAKVKFNKFKDLMGLTNSIERH